MTKQGNQNQAESTTEFFKQKANYGTMMATANENPTFEFWEDDEEDEEEPIVSMDKGFKLNWCVNFDEDRYADILQESISNHSNGGKICPPGYEDSQTAKLGSTSFYDDTDTMVGLDSEFSPIHCSFDGCDEVKTSFVDPHIACETLSPKPMICGVGVSFPPTTLPISHLPTQRIDKHTKHADDRPTKHDYSKAHRSGFVLGVGVTPPSPVCEMRSGRGYESKPKNATALCKEPTIISNSGRTPPTIPVTAKSAALDYLHQVLAQQPLNDEKEGQSSITYLFEEEAVYLASVRRRRSMAAKASRFKSQFLISWLMFNFHHRPAPLRVEFTAIELIRLLHYIPLLDRNRVLLSMFQYQQVCKTKEFMFNEQPNHGYSEVDDKTSADLQSGGDRFPVYYAEDGNSRTNLVSKTTKPTLGFGLAFLLRLVDPKQRLYLIDVLVNIYYLIVIRAIPSSTLIVPTASRLPSPRFSSFVLYPGSSFELGGCDSKNPSSCYQLPIDDHNWLDEWQSLRLTLSHVILAIDLLAPLLPGEHLQQLFIKRCFQKYNLKRAEI